MISHLARHKGLTTLSLVIPSLAVVMCIFAGTPDAEGIEWLDVIGEGSVMLVLLLWILALLISRPAGKLTRLLVVGLNLILFSSLLDLMDEFMDYADSLNWISMMESMPASVGMVMMTFAVWQWHKEQLALNAQWHTREGFVRNTEDLDPVTQIYSGEHWITRLAHVFSQAPDLYKTLVLLDINHFNQFNTRFGHEEGNRYLRGLASLLTLSLPSTSLVCRFAGDRFAILLLHDGQDNTSHYLTQLSDSIQQFAFYPQRHPLPIRLTARYAAEQVRDLSEVEDVIRALNRRLDGLYEQAA